jgi:hypothetical protein
MAVVIDQMDVVSSEQPSRGTSGDSGTASAAQPEAVLKRQIEQTVHRAAERAKRLIAD